jgi:hypothetical protein
MSTSSVKELVLLCAEACCVLMTMGPGSTIETALVQW